MASWFSRKDFLPAGLKAEQVELAGNTIRVQSRSAKAAAACPRCGTVSNHVHRRYRRRPADLPAHDRKVELILLVRRFRCRAMHCPTGVFAERFPPAVTRPHARRTSRLQGVVRYLGLALGGRPAQSLAERLGLPVSKDTFLRSVRVGPGSRPVSPASSASTTGHGAKARDTAH
ncbi:transposase family protein [Yoonia sp. 67-2]|uniref:transposase family protein n=1 Tax=Yoonia sp. 67-2 TaxID=3081448 RepID=UPI002B4173E4|nr:transposase family protein [Yoonia sp. 67-2]